MCNLLNYTILSTTTKPESQIPYGVVMIGAPLEWEETKGHGIKVAVLDTGCPEHPDIKVTKSESFIKDTYSTHKYDRNGHSTHVCGTLAANGNILGVAPEVSLYVGKVLNDIGGGTDDSISKGVWWAIEQGVDVISMSLGGNSQMPKTYEAIKEAYKKNILVVCAAGNDPWADVSYPARYTETVAVAAVDIKKNPADFSTPGKEVDVCAAGVEILSTWLNGKYATLAGTSMATPHISGAAALFQAKAMKRYGRKLTIPELRLLFDIYAEDLMAPGHDIFTGFGVFTFGRFEKQEFVRPEIKMELGSKTYYVNGVAKQMDTAPILDVNNRTLVPARYLTQEYGAQVDFVPPKTIVIK